METSEVPHITIANENAIPELLTNPTIISQNTLKIEIELDGQTRIFSRHINRKEMCEAYENPVGGFVESTANVSEASYVSPLTAVLDKVNILSGAIVIGQRMISGDQTISPTSAHNHTDVTV